MSGIRSVAARAVVSSALFVVAIVTVTVAVFLPVFAPETNYEVTGTGEVAWGVRRNLYPHAAGLAIAGFLAAALGVVVRGLREPEGYVALATVGVVAVGLVALTGPRLHECGWSSHISGPFEDDYSCFDGLAGLTPADPPRG